MNPFALLAFIALALMPFETIIADKSAVIFFYLALLFMALWFWREGQNPFAVFWHSLTKANRQVVVVFALLVAVSLLSIFSALDPHHSAKATIRLGVMALSTLALLSLAASLGPASQKAYQRWAIFAGCAAAVLLLADQNLRLLLWLVGDERTINYNNFAALLLSVFAFAFLAATHTKSKYAALALGVLIGIGIFASENQSAQLGFLTGLGVLLFYQLVKTLSVTQLCLLALAIYAGSFSQTWWRALFDAVALTDALPNSFEHRLYIWEAYTRAIFERPWLGYGLDSSEILFSLDAYLPLLDTSVRLIPIHPHNAAMALWFELGVLGLIAGALLLIIVASGTKRLNTALQPYASAALFSALVQLLLSRHPLQSTLFLGLVGVAVLFVMLEKAREKRIS